MHILALDLGTRRTGVAFADDRTGMALALDTITHTSMEELISRVREIVAARKVAQIIIGLPLLPSGEEGSQSAIVRDVGTKLSAAGVDVIFLDERHSTPRVSAPRKSHHGPPASTFDGDAAAAIRLLEIHLDRTQGKKG